MAFLNRIFRNRGLLENLGREPLAPILEPIRPRPIVTPFVPPQPVLPFPERLPDTDSNSYKHTDTDTNKNSN
jgi:hypothetical protein